MVHASVSVRDLWRRRSIRDASSLTAGNLVEAILWVVQGIVVARMLGAGRYGVAALVVGYASLLLSFLDARSSVAAVRYLSRFAEAGDTARALATSKLAYTVDFAIAAATVCVAAATAGWAASSVVHDRATAWLIVLYACAFLPGSAAGPSRAILSVAGRFRTLASVSLALTAARVAAVVALVWAGYGVAGVVVGSAAGLALSGVVLAVVAHRVSSIRWAGSWLRAPLSDLAGWRREMFRFLALTDLTEVLGLVSKQLDVVLLGGLRGPAEAGWYRLAKSLAAAAGHVVGPVQSVVYPRLSAIAARARPDEWRDAIRRLSVAGIPLGAAAAVGIVAAPWAVPFVAGRSFAPAVFPTQALLVGSAAWLAFFWLRPAYLAAGRIGEWTLVMTAMIVLLVAGYFVVTPAWGFRGMAVWLAAMQVSGHLVAAARFPRKVADG